MSLDSENGEFSCEPWNCGGLLFVVRNSLLGLAQCLASLVRLRHHGGQGAGWSTIQPINPIRLSYFIVFYVIYRLLSVLRNQIAILYSSSIPSLFLLYSSSIPPLFLLYSSSIPPLFLLYQNSASMPTLHTFCVFKT